MSNSAKLEELRKKFDENPRRYFAPLANEYRKAGDFDQAIFICQEYLPQQPGHMSGHIVFGQALFEAKRFGEAKTVFETALSLDPENLIALRHLGDISRDMGDPAAARSWYERVLHADPRNEEIASIMATLGNPAPASAATTADLPAGKAPTPEPPPLPKQTPASSAPTVVLSAAAIQEMVNARRAGSAPPPPPEPEPVPEVELISLDTVSTVEINAAAAEPEKIADSPPEAVSVGDLMPLDGLEPTSQAVTLETPSLEPLGLEPTSRAGAMDLPAFEPMGLETNMAPGEHATPAAAPATLDGLDSISLDLSIPGASPVSPTVEVPVAQAPPSPASAPAASDEGPLDLDASFSFGSPTPAAASTPASVAELAIPSVGETPIDGGHGGDLELLDLDLPSPPAKEEPSIPTMIIDAVKSIAPAVQDAVESTIPFVMDTLETAAPAVMDLVDTTIPSVLESVQEVVPAVIETVAEAPTMIIEAMKPPATKEPTTEASAPRNSQAVPFVTETMAQLYLSQGHRAEAIGIYKKLIEARPGDEELKSRLAAIERGDAEVATAVAEGTSRRFTGTGPSIRAVLRDLFGVDGSTASTNGGSPSIPGEVGSVDLLFSSESVADALSPLAVAFDGGYVAAQGTIDELFTSGAQ